MIRLETITPFKRSHYEPCLFTHVDDSSIASRTPDANAPAARRINITLYVDDGRGWDNCPEIADPFYTRLAAAFALTLDTDGLHFSLGMDISIGDGWVKICSTTYIKGLCKRWLDGNVQDYDQVYTPADTHLLEFYETALLTKGDGFNETEYRSLVGGLMWPAPTTRPDCLFCVGVLARALTFPTFDLFKCAKRVLIFMGQTANYGILYSAAAHDASRLVAWSDSDWATRRSTTGSNVELAGGSVLASSRRQDCTSSSSSHAEVIAASATAFDLTWSRGLTGELGLPQLSPTPLCVDAKNVITIVQNWLSSNKTRHIKIRDLVVREKEIEGLLEVTKVSTHDNVADILTKALDREPFVKLRRLLMQLIRVGVSFSMKLQPRRRARTQGEPEFSSVSGA